MTNIDTSTNPPAIQHWPATLPLTLAAVDCYQLRAALLELEAKAVDDEEWGAIADQRLEADDQCLEAPIGCDAHIVAKLQIIMRLAESMEIEDLLPFLARFKAQIEQFAQAAG
jgi:hypothetical protein